MSRKSEDAALLAQFLASGKSTKQILPGIRTMSERQIYLANRGITPAKPIDADDKPIVWRIVTDHAGREFYQNDQGEWL